MTSCSLLSWQPTPSAPRLVLFRAHDQPPEEAATRYVAALHTERRSSDLRAEAALNGFDLPHGEIVALSERRRSERPGLLLAANLVADLHARPQGDRILDIADRFTAQGLDVFVVPLIHDVGLSHEDAEAYRAELGRRFDAVLSLGGTDLSPTVYHERRTDAVNPSQARDRSEILLLHSLGGSHHLLLFGICRGSQLCAIAHGYQLIQDIHREVEHASAHKDCWHDVLVEEHSWLFRTVGARRFSVHSFHHEAVDERSGHSLIVTARAPDGVVEATETPDERMLGFQFHPELMRTPAGDKIMTGIAMRIVREAREKLATRSHNGRA